MLAGAERPALADAKDGFDGFFVREYPRCVAIARRLILDPHAAEDVAQDAFVTLLRRHDPGVPFASAWLHRAVLHLAHNALRARRRRISREQRSAVLEGPLQEASAGSDPLLTLVDEERRRRVRAVLLRLSERHRSVLTLRHAGLSYAETAAALGLKTNHVGTLLARAEAAFAKEISRVSPVLGDTAPANRRTGNS